MPLSFADDVTFAGSLGAPLTPLRSDSAYSSLHRSTSQSTNASFQSKSSFCPDGPMDEEKSVEYVNQQCDLIRRLLLPGLHERLARTMLAEMKKGPSTVDLKIKFSTKDLGIDLGILETHLPGFLVAYNVFAAPSCEYGEEQILIEPAYYGRPCLDSLFPRSSSISSMSSSISSSSDPSSLSSPSSVKGPRTGSFLGNFMSAASRSAGNKHRQLKQRITGKQVLTLKNFHIIDSEPEDYFF